MIEALRVMTYFKISLPTRNWDIAIKKPKHWLRFFLFNTMATGAD